MIKAPVLRSLATLFLGLSVGMVVAGESVLREHLRAESFIYYWLACIILTFLAMTISLVDFWLVRRQMRREQKRLFADALQAFADAGVEVDLRELNVRDF